MPALHGNYTGTRTCPSRNAAPNIPGYQGGARTTTGQSTGAHIVDERLTSIATAIPDLFSARRVLDIGCNAGQVAVDIGIIHLLPPAVRSR